MSAHTTEGLMTGGFRRGTGISPFNFFNLPLHLLSVCLPALTLWRVAWAANQCRLQQRDMSGVEKNSAAQCTGGGIMVVVKSCQTDLLLLECLIEHLAPPYSCTKCTATQKWTFPPK